MNKTTIGYKGHLLEAVDEVQMISRNVFTELDEDPALVDGGQDEGEENLADQAGSHQEHDQVSLLDDPSHPRFVLDVLERHQQQHICRIIQLLQHPLCRNGA